MPVVPDNKQRQVCKYILDKTCINACMCLYILLYAKNVNTH